ncbi:hypothetical protein [Actinomadura chibensis]|uniref:Uncharacterized protein n=1 Tax=Actinomadura chibensis TaxID=392828 RepID=A0A5D0NKH2_9ACTN|nr:hypothetical protein [Actinomadura chibensis]TYB44980.1 hypothetical protein FXF69_22920 [Actinomadura chibensis]
MPDITSELPRVLIEASKAELHSTGAIPRPQVHMLAEDMEHSYIGFVICRMFYRGQDAVTAIGDLGTLPSVLKMTRLMILWEDLDLLTALNQVTDPGSRALVLLDAQFDRHTLHRHPFEAVPTGQVVNGVPTVSLRWETPQRFHDGPLPEAINRLLRTWRELREDDMQETAMALQRSGYELNWATPTG